MAIRVLLAGTRLLGNKTYIRFVKSLLQKQPSLDLSEFYLEEDDFETFPARISSISNSLHASAVVRRKLAANPQILSARYNAVFLVSNEFLAPFASLVCRTPTALMLDTPPKAGGRIAHLRSSQIRRIMSGALMRVTDASFRRNLEHVDHALPFSQWCANELIEDYGFPADRTDVTYAPLDLENWRPNPDARTVRRKQLLFVGNDFERKGGLRLIRLHQQHLAEHFDLMIASREELASRASAGARHVTCRNDLTTAELLEFYQSASALVLPTTQDFSPMVLFEAIGAGLTIGAVSVILVLGVASWGVAGALLVVGVGAALVSGLS